MTNLVETKKIIGRLRFPVVVIVLILIFSSLILFRYSSKSTPQNPKETPPAPNIFQDPRQKPPSKINFIDLEKIQLPKQLPVFIYSKIVINEQNYTVVASAFGFSQNPFLVEDTLEGKQFNWKENTLRLSVNQTTIRFSNSTQDFLNKRLSSSELQNIAGKFIDSIPLIDKSATLNREGTTFLNLKDEDFTSSDSEQNAGFVEFNYFKSLEGFPVYYGQPDAPITKIRMSTEGTIIYFETKLYSDFQVQDTFDLKDINDAAKEVKAGRGKIVKTILPDNQGNALELYRIQPVNITTLDIGNVSPAFLLTSDESNTIQPIYVFEGNFDFTPSQKGQAVIYLPAINSN